MSDDQHEQLERRLREASRALAYPPTPDVAGALRRRQPRRGWRIPAPVALALGLLVAMSALLLAVPEVRAAALEALRIGVVRIFPAPPVTPEMAATVAPEPGPPTATPGVPTPTRAAPDPLRDLRGATTLEGARALLPFALRLPADLGPPDAVFVQELPGPAAILVWREPADPSRTRLALYILSDDAFAQKIDVRVLEETTVGGRRAVWASGPYVLQLGEPGNPMAIRRLVEGNTLIWEDGGLTYRLETRLPLEEAVRIAESLQ